MTIYDELVPYYDQLFPVSAQQQSFFHGLLRQPRPLKILDAGCGTGRHMELFVHWGNQVTGIEPAESMANEARRRLAWAGQAVKVLRAPIQAAADVLTGSYDFVVCLGNTLAHLSKPGELEQGIAALARLTAPGGSLLTQTVHFEKVLQQRTSPFRDTEIITPHGNTLTFSRRYHFHQAPEIVLFELALIGPDTSLADVIELRPIVLAEQTAALENAGYSIAHVWGDWSQIPRHAAAPATIVHARKK